MSRIRILALTLALSSVAATPAIARQSNSAETRLIYFSDLDLTSPSGVAALDNRIRGAVHDVCGQANNADLQAQAEIRYCRAETMNDARTQRSVVLARSRNGSIQLASRR